MNRTTLIKALLVTAIGSVAIAGCKKKEVATPAPAPAPAATVPAPAPAPAIEPAAVVSVDLGNAIGTDNRVAAPLSVFAKGDTIHASIASSGGASSRVGVKWSYQNGQESMQVNSDEREVAAGAQVTEFRISKPDGWPAGKYKLDVSLNGAVVQSREFEVK